MGYVLITGANLKNKGAAAMLYIAVNEVKKRFPGEKIVALSDVDAYRDEETLSEYSFMFRDMVCLYGRKYKLIQHRYGKLDRYGDAKLIASQTDLIIDVSGYTFGSNWGMIPNVLAAYRAKRAAKLGAPIFYMPQSFGPFEYKGITGKIAAFCMKKWLPKAKMIFCREREGYLGLKNAFGLSNIQMSEDLVLQNTGIRLENVFSESYLVKDKEALPEILPGSVALLPNIRNFSYADADSVLLIYRRIITSLLDLDRKVYIIAHSTEDSAVCARIKEKFADNPMVTYLDEEFSCLKYEKLVSRFDYIIASRYHAIVHAYRNAVPCIVLGWATKYRELLSKFRQADYAFDVRENPEPDMLISMIRHMDTAYERESLTIKELLGWIQSKNVFDVLGTERDVMGRENDIRNTVRSHLCNSCGICDAVCPVGAITFEKVSECYHPKINENVCIKCGKCQRVCAGLNIRYAEMPEADMEPSCYSVQTKNEEYLKKSTSGGFVSSLIKSLLDKGEYDVAFVVKGYSYEDQLSVKPVYNSENLVNSWKSRYVPVSQSEAVRYIERNPGKKVIFIGVPCAVHGLLKFIKSSRECKRENVLIIGLFCDMCMNYSIYDFAKNLYKGTSDISEFYFRDKRAGGWPGNMRIVYKDGTYRDVSAKERMIMKDFCKMERCLYCLDKLNAFADFSVGDNYTGRDNFVGGANSLIIRTSLGRSVWGKVCDEYKTATASFRDICESQKLAEKAINYRNNRVYASEHYGHFPEEGAPYDLTAFAGELGFEVKTSDQKRLKKEREDLNLGRKADFDRMRDKGKWKKVKLYENAIKSRFKM